MKVMLRGILVAIIACLAACTPIAPIKEVCKTEYVPIVSVPAPPQFNRPSLPIDNLTPEQLSNNGEMAKRYVATVKTLEDYSNVLETVIAEYQKKHDEAEVIANQIKGQGKVPLPPSSVTVTSTPANK